MIVTELLTKAKKVNNYELYSASGPLWTDTTHYRATVPVGKRWFVLGGAVKRDASATINTGVYDAADKQIGKILDDAAGTGLVSFPEDCYFIGTSWILEAGEYIESVFGAAQGTGAYHSCVVVEIDV